MTNEKSWTLGAPGTNLYKLYDGMRKSLNRKLVNYLLQRTFPFDKMHILEAGSGPASGSSLLAQDHRVSISAAADFDISALREARLRDPDLAVIVADLYTLPFSSDSWDLVWNNSTIDHLENPLAAMVEMGRITRKDGYVFVGAPYMYGPLGFQKWIPNSAVGVWIGRVFSDLELKKLSLDAGLEPKDVMYYFLCFFIGVLLQKR
jgi:SAM-dependent methyltransferase